MAPPEASTANEALISKEFLQEILNQELKNKIRNENTPQEIVKFIVASGSKPGDNYSSIIYTVDVELVTNKTLKRRHLLIKCYPSHDQRQEFLNNCNLFFKELEIYSKWLPELIKFQTQIVGLEQDKIFTLPYAKFVHGESIDFRTSEGKLKLEGILHPLENYIVLEDIVKTYGFRLADRREPLDIHHMRLVFDALATIHSLSWAYKQLVENDLVGKFPCLTSVSQYSDIISKLMTGMLVTNLETQMKMFDEEFGPGNELSQATEKFTKVKETIGDIFCGKIGAEVLQIPEKNENPIEPWRVVAWGDCWINNMLFRYDPDTKKPLEVVLIDLQIVQETCVVNDLEYVVYTCTDATLRKNHLGELLQIYHDKFTKVCNTLKCPTLPGFNMESLTYKFNRSKLIGYFMAVTGLPMILKEEDQVVDMEKMEAGKDVTQAFSDFSKGADNNNLYRQRIVEVTKEMIIDGLL